MLCSVKVARPKQRTLGGEGDRLAEGGVDSSRQLVALGAMASCLLLTRPEHPQASPG